MKGEKHLIYRGGKLPDPFIKPVVYKPEFFQKELDNESEVFYKLRKSNDIQPYRINQSSSRDIEEIKAFFIKSSNSFFFLFDNDNLVGSILFLRNYILPGNIEAEYLYEKLGFVELIDQ